VENAGDDENFWITKIPNSNFPSQIAHQYPAERYPKPINYDPENVFQICKTINIQTTKKNFFLINQSIKQLAWKIPTPTQQNRKK
jgi:hypothetical protein